ncbi:putative anti-restriction protein (plasmid) [Escherichia coli O139:H28 str. E24377A]|uniref:Putative anti-restriction protein n=1 Tax=Escherichia coli O139:H28 (strain E24377A / ETEC) TaxID=331111 RepID=A7ZH13_ECO24|nr:putative anti-restriction protein [Escherichia coli O139:H28 str. E24377A]
MRRVLCTRRNKEVAGGSAFTRPCGAWPCGFSALWPQRRVRAVPCLHLSRAGRDARVRFAACRALHQDEADPELMFQDYEGFPGNMASECHINWAWVEGFRQARDEGCEEAYRLWVEDTGETDFDTFRDAWWGEADSEEAFAVEFASDTGLLADVPETVALYFDYEAYARDLFLDSFTFIDGHVFRR